MAALVSDAKLIQPYQTLQGCYFKNNIYRKHVVINTGTGPKEEELIKILGSGGSKKAFLISGARALLLPNLDECEPSIHNATYWERVVDEEVRMSELISRMGIFSLSYQRASLALSECHEIPALVSETFESLWETRRYKIIDLANHDSSTWIKRVDSLFESNEQRLNEKNWAFLDSLATDIAVLIIHGIPINGDSLNVAVIEKPSKASICQYELRIFCFDFSVKKIPIKIPALPQVRPFTPEDTERARTYFKDIMFEVLKIELPDLPPQLWDLRDKLTHTFGKIMEDKMKAIAAAASSAPASYPAFG